MGSANFSEKLGRIIDKQRTSFWAAGVPSADVRIGRLARAERILVDNADAIAAALSRDFGHRSADQTLIADIFAAVSSIRFASANVEAWMKPDVHQGMFPDADARVEYQPLGVIGVIGPWNFPFNLVFAPLAGVLAAGNRAIIKPSEYTPEASELMRQLVSASFDESEVAVVLGGAAEGSIFSSAKLDHLLFTGSGAVAKHVMRAAAENLVPVTLELGGKSPVVLGADCDPTDAAARIMAIKTFNAGQICLAPDHVYVPRDLEPEFTAACVEATVAMYPDGLLSDDYTSVVSDRHHARLRQMVDDARQKGAVVLEPLGQDGGNRNRMGPVILTGVSEDMLVMKEEIFGPILPVVAYDSVEEVAREIRTRDKPLALYYFGADDCATRRLLDSTTSGGVTINDVMTHVFAESLPFGGVGASGMGSYHGRAGFLNFSHARSVYRQSEMPEAPMLVRPPYREGLRSYINSALKGLASSADLH